MKYFSSVSGKSLKFFSVTSELFVVSVVLFSVSFVSFVEVLVVVSCFGSLGPQPTKPDKSTATHKPDSNSCSFYSPTSS